MSLDECAQAGYPSADELAAEKQAIDNGIENAKRILESGAITSERGRRSAAEDVYHYKDRLEKLHYNVGACQGTLKESANQTRGDAADEVEQRFHDVEATRDVVDRVYAEIPNLMRRLIQLIYEHRLQSYAPSANGDGSSAKHD